MASETTTQPITITTTAPNNDRASFDLALSPTEPGKFDFYRVHLKNQGQNNDSRFSDNSEAPNSSIEIPKVRLPFPHMRHLSDHPKTVSSSSLYNPTTKSSTDSDNSSLNKKPIQTVASFSTLTDAVKNAMNKGLLNTTTQSLRRPASGTTLSSKELNHLSPQSM